ncbi:unnamed protein product, partial [Gongylonema pulchrum]|uniref:Aldo_ket_red domain-containing protein n=1 Tax=Gongylonema pulchrum TaxID=637853 RepID=A0A183E9A1_9BILA
MTPSIKLNSGHYIPSVGLGTWLSPPGQVGDAVKVALNNGYEHIDCAHAYRNQVEIGDALADIFSEGKIKRQNIFITSKIWNTFHSYQMAKKGMDMILSELRLDYLDLCLIHWPHGYEEGSDFYPKAADGKKFRYSNIDYLETWLAMEDYVAKGKVRSIGLSNFNHKQIQRIMDNGNMKPAVLQVELHPYHQQRKLRSFCAKAGIVITAYSPLANPTMPFRKAEHPVELHPYHQQRKLRSFCAKAGIVITAYSPLANPTMPFRKAEHPVLLEDSQILQIAGTHNKTAAQ